jgi:hypothetical protein
MQRGVPCSLTDERAGQQAQAVPACSSTTDQRLWSKRTPSLRTASERSKEITEEVAYAETLRRYLILRMSGKGLSGVAPGRSR